MSKKDHLFKNGKAELFVLQLFYIANKLIYPFKDKRPMIDKS